MKTKFLLIGALILIAVGLSGCFWQEEEKPEQKSGEVSADTILDNKLFEDAVASNNAAICDKIKSATKKEECKTVLASFDLMARAEESKDKSLCSQIKLERYRTTCENEIETLIITEKSANERLEVEQEAVDKQDPSICNKIIDQNQKASCKFNAIVDKASQKNDKLLCNLIEHSGLIEQCLETVKTNNP